MEGSERLDACCLIAHGPNLPLEVDGLPGDSRWLVTGRTPRSGGEPRGIVALARRSLVVVVAIVSLLGAASARAQVVDAEARFVERIDGARRAQGLPAFVVAADLRDVARRHAQRMAERGEPYHNPALTSEVQGWDLVAENVGVGQDADGLHDAFMASQVHRDNILHRGLAEIGVGVVRSSDGRMWVVQVFRRPTPAPTAAPAAAPPSPPAPPASAPPPAPAPPPTTAPLAATPTAAAPVTTPPPPAPSATVLAAGPGTLDEAALVAPSTRSVRRGALDPAGAIPPLEDLARQIPLAAWIAAFSLSAVVGGQGLVLRRLGLVA